jgi:hypothetical protein
MSSSSSSSAAEAEAPPKRDFEAAASPGRVENSDSQVLMWEYHRAAWGYSEAEGAARSEWVVRGQDKSKME